MRPFEDCKDCQHARAHPDGFSGPLCTYNAPTLVQGPMGVLSPGFPAAVMRCRNYAHDYPPDDSQRPRPSPPKNIRSL